MNKYPTKILYNSYKNEMKIFYRKKNSFNLFKETFLYDFYTFIQKDNIDEDFTYYQGDNTEYSLLENMNEKYCKINITNKEFYEFKKDKNIKLAEDLTPEKRFIYDEYSDKEMPRDIQPRVHYIDIEVENTSGIIPSWENHIDVINALTVYDSYTKNIYSWFLKPREFKNLTIEELEEKFQNIIEEEKYDDMKNISININLFNDPSELLEDWISWHKKNIPDIITGWNTPFDIPYTIRKIYDYLEEKGIKELSPFFQMSYYVQSAIERGSLKDGEDKIIPGISVVDMMTLCKKFYGSELPSWSLDFVSKTILNVGKVEYKGTLDQLYHKDFDRFTFYNIMDVMRVVQINDIKKYMELVKTVRDISLTDFQDIFTMSRVVDGQFLKESVIQRMNGNNIVLPSTKSGSDKVKYCGAYVKEPLLGRHRCLSDLDYKSMYPSIIYTFNMSPETYRGYIVNWETLNYHRLTRVFPNMDEKIKEHIYPESAFLLTQFIDRDYLVNCKENIEEFKYKKIHAKEEFVYKYTKDPEILYKNLDNEIIKFENTDKFEKWLRKNNYNCVANGAIFEQTEDVPIMPKIVKNLMDMRDVCKGKKGKYLSEAKLLKDSDPELKNNENKIKYQQLLDEAEGNDLLQLAYKVVGNSCFTEDHELLTRDGVKNIKDVKIGDKITNFNPQTRCMEEDIIINTIEKPYDGFIYDIETYRGKINFSVTADHKFVLEDKKGNVVIKTIEEIYNEYSKSDRNGYYLYKFPLMLENKNIEKDKKISLYNFIKSYYEPEFFNNIDLYIIPIKNEELRLFKNKILIPSGLFDNVNLVAITSKLSKNISKRAYKVKLSELNDDQILYLTEFDNVHFNCYYKISSGNHKSIKTPFTFNYYDISKFLGWFISEGSLHETTYKDFGNFKRGITKNIYVYQYKNIHQEYHGEIVDLFCNKLKFCNVRITDRSIGISNTIFYDWLNSITNHKSKIPDIIMNSGSNVQQFFIETLYNGDGDSRYIHCRRYTVKERYIRDQIINILTNLGCNVRYEFEEFTKKDGTKGSYYRIYNYNYPISLCKKDITRKKFEGMVYCVTTGKNHTLQAGKNGTLFLTHNCYGVISMNSFRLFSRAIAEGVTSTGQIVIKTTEYLTNQYINKKSGKKDIDQVVCIDTDSIIFSMENIYTNFNPSKYTEAEIDEMKNFSFEVQNFINKMASNFSNKLFYKNKCYDRDILLVKPEWIGKSIVATGPKYYALGIIEEEGRKVNKLHARGIAIRRSDYTNLTKRIMSTILEDYILAYKSENETSKYLKEEAQKIKTYSLEEICKPTGVKNFSRIQYKSEAVNVRASKNFNELVAKDELDKIIYGKIKWVYLKSWKKCVKEDININDINKNIEQYNVVAYPVDKPEYADILKDYVEIDWKLMKEKLIIAPIQILYESLGWEIPVEILSDTKNTFNIFKKK